MVRAPADPRSGSFEALPRATSIYSDRASGRDTIATPNVGRTSRSAEAPWFAPRARRTHQLPSRLCDRSEPFDCVPMPKGSTVQNVRLVTCEALFGTITPFL